jgi:hypothetical protein
VGRYPQPAQRGLDELPKLLRGSGRFRLLEWAGRGPEFELIKPPDVDHHPGLLRSRYFCSASESGPIGRDQSSIRERTLQKATMLRVLSMRAQTSHRAHAPRSFTAFNAICFGEHGCQAY